MALSKTKGNYPAIPKIIDCVEKGMEYGFEAGINAELHHFETLLRSPQSEQLRNIFFAMTEMKKNPMQDKVVATPQIAVLGAGLMGAGIVEVSMKHSNDIILKDIKQETLSSAKKGIYKAIDKKVKRKSIKAFDAELELNKVHAQLDYEDFDKVDIVIEAVFEDLGLKQRILEEVESNTHDRCIFATNTSALPIKQIAAKAKRPELVVGMHYFSPVPKMPLLEIIKTEKTADWVTATALDIGIKQGKTCIVVNDGPGFYTTRILTPLLNEALLLLEDGASIEAIDEAAMKMGFPVGPVLLMDEVGIDVGAHIMKGELTEFFKSRGEFRYSDGLLKMYDAGYHGRKNKKGFYVYDKAGKRKKGAVNDSAYSYFGGPERIKMNETDMKNRLTMVMANEAVQCLHEGIISSPRDGDIGAIFGLGFPPFLGGPFRFLDSLGHFNCQTMFENLTNKYGPRFTASPLLAEMDQRNEKFYN
ncbi:UNVERIFIED_CONTAM: hypothetical protein GTU68_039272 [Idotea baltica]|nr:hypothetical protein [Idotea baltica]